MPTNGSDHDSIMYEHGDKQRGYFSQILYSKCSYVSFIDLKPWVHKSKLQASVHFNEEVGGGGIHRHPAGNYLRSAPGLVPPGTMDTLQ